MMSSPAATISQRPPRRVTLPVFATVVQGGNLVLSKEIGSVDLNFADGQARAVGRGGVRTSVARAASHAAADEIQAKVNRKRKADRSRCRHRSAADPLVRAALRAASFEVLIGFQLTKPGLAYNVYQIATRRRTNAHVRHAGG